jgi:ribosomal protein RSM22 (predicted rRNA methylase)
MQLPDTLRLALTDELTHVPQKHLATSTAALSSRYRKGPSPDDSNTILYSSADVAAYAAYRLPATFAAIHAVLHEVRKRQPDWQPRTMLDAGAGPGSAMWAARELWPSIEEMMLLERASTMIEFGKRLAGHASAQALKQAVWKRVDLSSAWECTTHDLVITSYVLGEIPAAKREAFIERLWTLTSGILVIIEPGTPVGYSHMLQARTQLIAANASVIAPCPHNTTCPMDGHDWCHFAQRVARTQLHRQAKQGTLSYEDEKYSYVACSRMVGTPITGRVVRHPQARSGHIYLELCTPDGLQHTIVSRKDKAAFRHARNLLWGDALPFS